MKGIVMRKILLATATAAVLMACSCSFTFYEVHKLSADDGIARTGVVYRLPRTDTAIVATIKTTTKKPGKWSCYNAALGLALDDFSKECETPVASTSEHSVSGATIETSMSADPNATYLIDVKTIEGNGRGLADRGIELKLTSDARLTSSSGSVTDRTGDLVAASIGAAAKIAGAATGIGAAGAVASTQAFDGKDRTPAALTNACLAALSRERKESTPEDKVICDAAERLKALMAARDAIITRPLLPNVSAPQLEATLRALDARINALSANFYTTVVESKTIQRVRFDPTVSSNEYCVAKGRLGECSGTAADLRISLDGTCKPRVSAKDKQGVVYVIPDALDVVVSTNESNTLVETARKKVLFPQCGRRVALPNSVTRAKSGSILLELSEETGMLKSISFQKKADYSDIANAIGGSAGQIEESGVELRKSRAAAEDARAREPIDELKRRLEQLELERQLACYAEIGTKCPDAEAGDEDAEE